MSEPGQIGVMTVDGQLINVSPEDAEAYLRHGGRLVTAEEQGTLDHSDPLDYVKTGAEGFLSGATLGMSDQLETSVLDNAKEHKEREEAHPWVAGLSDLAGNIALTAATEGESTPEQAEALAATKGGELASRLGPATSGLVDRMLAKAAPEAGEQAAWGAAFGAGHVIHENALGDPNFSAEALVANPGRGLAEVGGSAAAGGILGGLLAGGGELAETGVRDFLSRGIRKLGPNKPSETLTSMLEAVTREPEAPKTLADHVSDAADWLTDFVGSAGKPEGVPTPVLDKLAGDLGLGKVPEVTKAVEKAFPEGEMSLKQAATKAAADQLSDVALERATLLGGVDSVTSDAYKLGLGRAGQTVKDIQTRAGAVQDSVLAHLGGALKEADTRNAATYSWDDFKDAFGGKGLALATSSQSPVQTALHAVNTPGEFPEASNILKTLWNSIAKGGSPDAIESSLGSRTATGRLDLEGILKLKKTFHDVLQERTNLEHVEAINDAVNKVIENEKGRIGYTEAKAQIDREAVAKVTNELFNNAERPEPMREAMFGMSKDVSARAESKTLGDLNSSKNHIRDLKLFARDLTDMDFKHGADNYAFVNQGINNLIKSKVAPEAKVSVERALRALDVADFVSDAAQKQRAKPWYDRIPDTLKNFWTEHKASIISSGVEVGLLTAIHPAGAGLRTAKVVAKLAGKAVGDRFAAKLPDAAEAVAKKAAVLSQLADNNEDVTSKIGHGLGVVFGAAAGKAALAVTPALTLIDRQKQLAERAEQLRNAAIPDVLNQRLAGMTENWRDHAPQTAMAATVTGARAINFLNAKLPRPTRPSPADLVTGKSSWTPSAQQIDQFNRYWDAAHDPHSILRSAAEGKLTKEEVEAVSTIYPQLYKKMQGAVMDSLQKSKGEIPQRAKGSINKLMGTTSSGGATVQAIYASKPRPDAIPQPSGKPAFKASTRAALHPDSQE